MKKIVLCFAVVAALGGCVVESGSLLENDAPAAANTPDTPAAAPNVPRNLSPAALAALPRGMSPEFLIKDASNCYAVALEQSEPVRGVPLLNDAGQQVCDA